jgi:hypothetical protein
VVRSPRPEMPALALVGNGGFRSAHWHRHSGCPNAVASTLVLFRLTFVVMVQLHHPLDGLEGRLCYEPSVHRTTRSWSFPWRTHEAAKVWGLAVSWCCPVSAGRHRPEGVVEALQSRKIIHLVGHQRHRREIAPQPAVKA